MWHELGPNPRLSTPAISCKLPDDVARTSFHCPVRRKLLGAKGSVACCTLVWRHGFKFWESQELEWPGPVLSIRSLFPPPLDLCFFHTSAKSLETSSRQSSRHQRDFNNLLFSIAQGPTRHHPSLLPTNLGVSHDEHLPAHLHPPARSWRCCGTKRHAYSSRRQSMQFAMCARKHASVLSLQNPMGVLSGERFRQH